MDNGKGRIIGVDVAKIVAMLLVVAVHVNGFGLPYAGDTPPGLCYLLLRSFLGAIFMACINIFAIVSGYVGIESSFRLSRIIRLWLQVVFTGILVLACLELFTDVSIQRIDYIKACVPIAKRQYWYITAYFMLCFVMPLINAGIRALTKIELRNMLLLLLAVICGESFLVSAGVLGVEFGYSFEWLLVLYVVGAYIRLYNPLDKPKASLLCAVVVSAMVAGWMPLACNKVPLPSGIPRLFEFGGYTSPFTVIIALCIFALCLKVRIVSPKGKMVIGLLSATTLGVYLIHVQPVFFKSIFIKVFGNLTVSWGGGYLCSIIISTIAIYLVCTLIDCLRIILFRTFERLLDSFCEKRGNAIS